MCLGRILIGNKTPFIMGWFCVIKGKGRGKIMAIYAFDGTTCTPSDLSNVFKMYEAYDSPRKFYATGPGSRGTFISKAIESMTGHGGKDRIHDAYEIWRHWNKKGSKETVIIGFSRGAVVAREFANKICADGKRVDFIGLYDSVGSFGNPFNMRDIGYRKTIPVGVSYCAQALAIHEERFTFRVIRALPAKGNNVTPIEECWFPGVHSDIGGTLKKGLGACAIYWMFEQGIKAGIKQWICEEIKTAKNNLNPDEEPSKNSFSLPRTFFQRLRTRKIKKTDTLYC